jgi:hypothetical protein
MMLTPIGDLAVGQALRFFVAPLLVASGVLMWQHARGTRFLRTSTPGGAKQEGKREP